MKKFSELPVKIQKRMLEAQVEQGNEANSAVFEDEITSVKYSKGFNWGDTLERFKAWRDALVKNYYTPLYNANPSLKPDSEEEEKW